MKLLLPIVVALLFISPVAALPTLQTGAIQTEEWECSSEKAHQKRFSAKNTRINTGIVCPLNAEVQLYACGPECLSSIPVARGYKIHGKLPLFTGFEKGDNYYYECFACRDSSMQPVISVPEVVRVLEGETVHIPATCTSLDSTNTQMVYEGWMQSDTKETTYSDAGNHHVSITCYDSYSDFSSVDVVIEVINNNRPPHITVRKRG